MVENIFIKIQNVMKLTAYDVIIWHRSPSTPPNLYVHILEKANMAPYESTYFDGFQDIHWGFSKAADSSQTMAIEMVRAGRSLLIQGSLAPARANRLRIS